MKRQLVLGIVLGLGIGIGLAISFMLRPHMGPPPWQSRLNLTTEEKQQIKQLFDEDKSNVRNLFKEMNASNEELKKGISDKSISDEQLREMFNKSAHLREELTNRRFEMNLKIRKIVGPDRMSGFDLLSPPPPRHHGRPGEDNGQHRPPPDEDGPGNDHKASPEEM